MKTPGFLDTMAASSTARVVAARAREGDASIRARALAAPRGPRLQLDGRFDLIAELKLRSPALGQLGAKSDDFEARVTSYARGGAAAISVLTEPDRFDGDLSHLERAARALEPLGVPAMRKDFLVDAYQLYEARLAGAGGALLIVTMLDREVLAGMLVVAAELGLFVLLETFDELDVAVARELVKGWNGPAGECLVGVNSRNLQTLQVVPEGLEQLAASLPQGHPRVAESGLVTADDAARLARAGYTMALVGTALMSATDPAALAGAMIAAGRTAVRP